MFRRPAGIILVAKKVFGRAPHHEGRAAPHFEGGKIACIFWASITFPRTFIFPFMQAIVPLSFPFDIWTKSSAFILIVALGEAARVTGMGARVRGATRAIDGRRFPIGPEPRRVPVPDQPRSYVVDADEIHGLRALHLRSRGIELEVDLAQRALLSVEHLPRPPG